MSQPAVEARALSKRFGALTAVDAIDFSIAPGSCVGFLGPNGAGKTTTVRMLSCQTDITSGEARVFGLDVARHPREVKALIGMCPQEDNLDPDFSVRRNLTVFARYFGLPRREAEQRASELLQLVQLGDKSEAAIGQISGGMKRRLVLARSMINRPRLLILDEPSTGLDPQSRQAIWGRVRKLRDEGVTVLLTTHYMEEAAQLCDRVLLIDHGKILLEGRPADLIRTEVGAEVVELWQPSSELRAFASDRGWDTEALEDRMFIYGDSGTAVEATISEHFPNHDRLLRRATLEDVFLRRTGHGLRD